MYGGRKKNFSPQAVLELLYTSYKQSTCYSLFPFCHNDCLLDSLQHAADMTALIHHSVLDLQDPAQGMLWQCLSLNSEVWKTKGSEVWSEGSSSDHCFRDILITYSHILPHNFLSHFAFPQRKKSCINLHLYTNSNFGQLLQFPLAILFAHNTQHWIRKLDEKSVKDFPVLVAGQISVGKCSWLMFRFPAPEI